MNYVSLTLLAALTLSIGLQMWLAQRQLASLRRHRDRVPAAFARRISLATHQRAASYTGARTRLELIELAYGAILLLAWTLGGGLNLLDGLWRGLDLPPLATGLGVIASVLLLMHLLALPTSLYSTFGIEARFGFNRTTLRVFLADNIKEVLILLLLSAPLAALVLWLMASAGASWWLWTWAAWMGFNALMLWAYPSLIAPLFNRFTPLDDEELRGRIEALLNRCGFSSDGIFVMDGSRRSGHGNAYFTGLGRHKRIVFYDTLLKSLTPEEVEAVLAHELGHYHHRHIHQHLLVLAGLSLAALFGLAQLIQWSDFYSGLGLAQPSHHAALLLLLLLGPLVGSFLQPLLTAASRRHEFQADAYAAAISGPVPLIQALVKLYNDNAAPLTPDPLYSAFHDSHPPAPVRIATLEALRHPADGHSPSPAAG